MKNSISIDLTKEFIRYGIVGGISFLVDFSVLYLFREIVLANTGKWGVYFAAAIGFTAGLIVNYFLSLMFVFLSAKNYKKGKDIKSFMIFSIIGIIGLGLTELGIYVGTDLMHINYLIAKIIITAIILLWNYGGRKLLIFR